MKELITIIIPAFNCENTIATAISSMQQQSYPNLEIIVVNDSSADNTKRVAQKMAEEDRRIIVIDSKDDPHKFDTNLNRNINAGWSARNTGLKIAKGKYVTFQDADDASLLNRLEIQYDLIKKYDAHHISLDWFQFDSVFLGKKIDAKRYLNEHAKSMIGPDRLLNLAKKTKGVVPALSEKLNSAIPFYWKRKKIINKLFFGSLEGYPGAGNSPLFRREVIEKVRFRPLKNRVWPSFMGRGADRDFNFQVAETFKNSYVFLIPAYMWTQDKSNGKYRDELKNYIIP